MQSLAHVSETTPISSLQYARPRLKSGQLFGPMLTSDASHIRATPVVYELTDGSRHIQLPTEALAVLPLLDGSRTLPDILEILHQTHGPIALKTVFDILQRLQAVGALEGAEILVTAQADLAHARRSDFFERAPAWFQRPIWSATIAPAKAWGEPSVPIFGLFALLTIVLILAFVVAAIGQGFIHIPPNFLRFQGSYVQGLLFFYVAASVILTAKTVIKALLTLFLTGSRSAIRLEFSVLAFALRSDDDKVYLVGGRTLGTLAFFAVISSYFFIFIVARGVATQWPPVRDLLLISSFVALAELNPFRQSDLSSFFSLVMNRKGAIDLLSYLEHRVLKTYVPYLVIAAVWMFAVTALAFSVLTLNAASLSSAVSTALGTETRVELLAIGIIGVSTLAILLTVLGRALRIVIQSVLFPSRAGRLMKRASSAAKATVFENVEILAHSLTALPAFAKMHQDARLFLLSKGAPHAHAALTPMLVQSSPTVDFQILVEGSVLVQRQHASGAVRDLAVITAPAILGENTVLAGTPHTADVIPLTEARTLSIPRKAIDELAHHSVLRTEAESLLDRLTAGPYFVTSPLFRNVPREIIGLILNEGEIIDIATGRHIVEQGRTDKDFYVVLRGSADVLHNGQIIAHILSGQVFGEEAMILNSPRVATIMTREPTRLLKVSARQFWQAISKYPALALRLEAITVSY